MARTRLRLGRLALALASVLAAQGVVSLVLLVPRVKAVLRARLERALGRPVEVGHFGVSVWTGVRLEAHYITVGEDPRFGYEFVLRADRLSATPRWSSLLRGRFEFSRYSFERPSLNLVRAPDAHWNFEIWAAPSRAAGAGASEPRRVDRVSFTNGRINFKRGAEKLPFTLTGVNGQISSSSDGRWSLNLEAQPLRAGISLQDAGTFRFAGAFPAAVLSPEGSATPELPVEFTLEWNKVSLSDALRLIAGNDFGVRGALEGSLDGRFSRPPPAAGATPEERGSAAAAGLSAPAWKISGTLRLADVHRWDLPLQAGAPALNVSLDVAGSADRREWEFREIVLDARRSRLRGVAAFRLGENSRASLRVISSSIHLDDLLAWYRAFHPGVRPGTSIDGYLGADVELRGWPVSIVHAALATTGARLNIPGETRPIELRRAVLEADGNGARLSETHLAAGADDPGMRLSGRVTWSQIIPFEATLVGGTAHLAEFSTAIAALGLSPGATPLRADGAVVARLDWKCTARPWRVATTGAVTLENVALSGGLLRTPVSLSKARLDFLPGKRRVQIGAAKAFGTAWTGSLSASTLAGPWDFALNAERLNPALLVRGFSNQPPDNSSLLARILPAQAAATLALETPRWPGWLRGEGTLAANSFELGRLQFARLKGRLSIGEREVNLENAEAFVYGGRVRGEVRAGFGVEPRYTVRADFDGVNVASLVTVALSTRQCCTGTATGHLELKAAGWTRDALLASLAGAGHAQVRSGALLTLDLSGSIERQSELPGRTLVRDASADLSFSLRGVELARLVLELAGATVEGTGSADYRGGLDVSITPQGKSAKTASVPRAAAPANGIRVTGTLAAPQVRPQSAVP